MSAAATASAQLSVNASTNDGVSYLILSGEFVADDQFENVAQAILQHTPEFIVFDSPGGSPYAAMRLGRLIRSLGVNTLQIKQLECSSACALAFMGGVKRAALPGSIGVHQSSFKTSATLDRDGAVEQIQEATADLLAYLEEMGVDAGLLQVALRYDRDDMRYLSASEMAALRVTNMGDDGSAAPPSYAPQQVTPSPSAPTSQQAALNFVRSLVDAHTARNLNASSLVARAYAGNVSYFGRSVSAAEVAADKARYFQRWPERWYRIHDDTVSVTCQTPALCTVTGLYDWSVRSQARNSEAAGLARFSYMIRVGEKPLVLSEGGEVIRR